MTESQSVSWAEGLANALDALKKQEPKPLLRLVEAMSDQIVSPSDLATYFKNADENDRALTQARMALATWDALDEYADVNGDSTP